VTKTIWPVKTFTCTLKLIQEALCWGGGGKDEKEEKRGEEGGRRGRGGEELSLDKLVGTK
jgi:hypothetical protein